MKAQEGGFALVFLDVMMTKLDGLGFLKALKYNPPKQASGPVLLLTNLAHDPVVSKALDLGAKSYLIKSDLNPD